MKPALPELESSPQDGGGGSSTTSTAELGGGGGAGPEETAAAEAARSHGHEQPQHTSEAPAAALPKGAEEPERPVRRSFQIPRKSREKKGGASPSPRPPLYLSLPPSSIFSLGPRCLLLFFPHPPETRKHAREQAPAVSLALAATAAQLRLGREQRVEPRSAAPPVPVEAGSSSGLKRIHKAAAPREERWGSVPPPSQPPMAEKLMWPPPKDASEKSACGNSPWPWILRLSPRPLRSEDKCFLTMEILQLCVST